MVTHVIFCRYWAPVYNARIDIAYPLVIHSENYACILMNGNTVTVPKFAVHPAEVVFI